MTPIEFSSHCRLQRSRNRAGWKVDEDHRLPADFGGFADRSRGEFRGAGDEQGLRARALQADDLGVHRRLGDVIGSGDDPPIEVGAEKCPEGGDVVFAEVVVLEQDRILCVQLRYLA